MAETEKPKKEHKPKKHKGVDQMLLRRAGSGGYIAKHPHPELGMNHDEAGLHHALPNMAALQAHLGQHMPEAGEAEEPEPGAE